MKLVLILAVLFSSACSTLQTPERTAQIPPIPVEKKDCDSPLGAIPDGGSAVGFLNAVESGGRTCESGPLTCHDGEWSGPYVHLECTALSDAP